MRDQRSHPLAGQCFHDKVEQFASENPHVLTDVLRLTSFPILLAVAYYERQAKYIHATTFSETVSATAERVMETLPRSVKRLSQFIPSPSMCYSDSIGTAFFEGFFAGKLTDIDVVCDFSHSSRNFSQDVSMPDFRHRRRNDAAIQQQCS